MNIAFDTKLKRPGCPLLQAALGGCPDVVSKHFDTKTWLLAPTPDLKIHPLTNEILEKEKVGSVNALFRRAKKKLPASSSASGIKKTGDRKMKKVKQRFQVKHIDDAGYMVYDTDVKPKKQVGQPFNFEWDASDEADKLNYDNKLSSDSDFNRRVKWLKKLFARRPVLYVISTRHGLAPLVSDKGEVINLAGLVTDIIDAAWNDDDSVDISDPYHMTRKLSKMLFNDGDKVKLQRR